VNKQMKVSLLIFAIGVFMAALDNGIVTSSLTTLIYSFGVSPTWGAWTITLYTLGLAISVPLVGKLSDRYGRKKLFFIEVALFGIGSALVAASPNFTFFLIARLIQALGGGGIFIIGSSYVLNAFPKEKHGMALGALGGMHGIASVLGPNIGSFILNVTGNWHWLFLINVPIAIALLIFGGIYIKEKQVLSRARMDWLGIVALSATAVCLMYGFTKLDGVNLAESLASPAFLGFMGGGLLLIAALVLIEKRAGRNGIEPVIPGNLMRIPAYRLTLVMGVFSGAILASVIFVPAFVEQYLGVDSAMSGYWFTPLAIASGIGAGSGGMLVDRKGPTATLVVASSLAIVGFLLFGLWVENTWQMVVASSFVGLGFGTMLGAPLNVLASEHSENDKGISLAGLSLFRQMGMTIAPTIYAGFLARSFAGLGDNIQAKLGKAGISQAAPLNMPGAGGAGTGQMDFATLKAGFESIPDPKVKDAMLGALHDTVDGGYASLFYTALGASVLMLIVAIATGIKRSRKRGREQAVGQEG